MKYSAVLFDYGKTLSGQFAGKWVDDLIVDLYNCGYRLGIVSNSNRYGDYRWLRQHMTEKKLSQYFDFIIGSGGMIGRMSPVSGLSCEKPNLETYQRALFFLGLQNFPQKVVFVGDTLGADCIAPSFLGIVPLLVDIDKAIWGPELWELLEDSKENMRQNILTEYLISGEKIITPLKHLTEPLFVGERIIAGVTEYRVVGFDLPHTKEDILDTNKNHRTYISIGIQKYDS